MQRTHSLRHLFWRTVLAAAGDVGVTLGLYPIAPHLGVAIQRRRAGQPQPPGAVRAAAAEWAVAAAVSAARPLGVFHLPLGLPQARGPRPVVLLHGFLMGRMNFLVLAHRLRAAGIGPLAGFEYWTLSEVATAARRLGAFVDELRARLGAPRVDVVGHSMGGMVGRYLVTLGGRADAVENLITIGTPHGGTPASRFGFGAASVELDHGSALVRELAAAPLPPSVRITAIWSRGDGLVPAARFARLPGADEGV